MHIADGVLNPSLLLGATLLATVAVGRGIKKTDYDDVPRLGVLASFYFVVSLIHVPIGPFSSHLIMNGFLGLVLGWGIFPVLVAALFLQKLLFGFGGMTSLPVNVLIMGLPGLACYYLASGNIFKISYPLSSKVAVVTGMFIGGVSVLLTCFLFALTLFLNGKEFVGIIGAVLLGHIPVVIIDASVTGAALSFLCRIKPEMIGLINRKTEV